MIIFSNNIVNSNHLWTFAKNVPNLKQSKIYLRFTHLQSGFFPKRRKVPSARLSLTKLGRSTKVGHSGRASRCRGWGWAEVFFSDLGDLRLFLIFTRVTFTWKYPRGCSINWPGGTSHCLA